MDKKIIITIGREYGSGGRKIGQRVAKLLSIPFYDKEIIMKTASETGIYPEFFENIDEQIPFLSYIEPFYYMDNVIAPDNLFNMQSRTILELAAKSSCVIVGRCADYILRDEPSLVNCFISAPISLRIKNIMKYENITDERKARNAAKRISRQRSSHYKFVTGQRWGYASSYDLCVDSSALGVEGTALLIKDFAKNKLQHTQ